MTYAWGVALLEIGCEMMRKQHLMYVVFAVFAVLLYVALVLSILVGLAWLAVLLSWMASPLARLQIWFMLEERRPRGIFDPKVQSWAFLFGDILFLPFAFMMAALGWDALGIEAMGSWGTMWIIACAALGVYAGYKFHMNDKSVYAKANASKALNSPGKWWHDFNSYPVLFGGLFATGVPLLFMGFWPYGLGVLGGFALWLLCGIRDMKVDLDPLSLHTEWDEIRFQPL